MFDFRIDLLALNYLCYIYIIGYFLSVIISKLFRFINREKYAHPQGLLRFKIVVRKGLSQAHARLMYRQVVLPVDAITAIMLMDLSMQDCTLSDTSDALHSTFSKYPDFEYLKTAKSLLSSLNIFQIWHEELLSYGKILNVEIQQLDKDIDDGNLRYFCINDSQNYNDENITTDVVESSYFKQSTSKQSEQSKNINVIPNNSQNILMDTFGGDIEKDEEFDSILNLNDFNTKPKTNDNLIETENSANLLAKTLKKHSNLNSNKNGNIGMITGKRKREFTKDKKTKQLPRAKKLKKHVNHKNSDEDPSSLQLILNELKGNKSTKQSTSKKKQSKIPNVKENQHISDSSSDEEVNDSNVLNYLPSVNDAFHDFTKIFNQNISEDEQSIFEDSQPINDQTVPDDITNKDIIVNSSTKLPHSDNKNNSENITDNTTKMKDELKSPVNMETLQKLNQFSFHSRSTKKTTIPEIRENHSLVSRSPCTSKTLEQRVALQRNISQTLRFETTDDKNETNETNLKNLLNKKILINLNSSQSASSNGPSQRSIFENDDDDYDALDI